MGLSLFNLVYGWIDPFELFISALLLIFRILLIFRFFHSRNIILDYTGSLPDIIKNRFICVDIDQHTILEMNAKYEFVSVKFLDKG
jgi:hypothetical protein